ncbi:MAG: prepilin-type N-terminal cleavage/methylation domain-containing protein [Verrucomicrobiae bacterium]|nr:prepilin-type N-terminal cleavage/methylation domain-containing protein [Verrucomicrobiae bacterium]MCP5540306.1 prepilin-type N-terminal cleavage/methylation domain-containing protein [Akkermansiaceae bacterium]MCP5550682.1 prepilin-type N-terminal cleavage/methylation domain-containing protein [Akkermansiaceae bacterium]
MKRNRHASRRRRAGFTMTEMLIAIAVIGVLAGIGIPAYDRVKNQARATQCIAKLREIGSAINLYGVEHAMKMPEMVAAREDKHSDEPALDTVLLPYVNDEFCFQCPADSERIWERTGTSYFWNSTVNEQDFMNLDFLGLTKNHSGIPLVADKENFHEHVGDEVNILYADGHVQHELQFTVDGAGDD